MSGGWDQSKGFSSYLYHLNLCKIQGKDLFTFSCLCPWEKESNLEAGKCERHCAADTMTLPSKSNDAEPLVYLPVSPHLTGNKFNNRNKILWLFEKQDAMEDFLDNFLYCDGLRSGRQRQKLPSPLIVCLLAFTAQGFPILLGLRWRKK